MADTMEDVWRRSRLEMPSVPPLLIRSWVQEAYARACESWSWAFLRAEGTLITHQNRSVVCTATSGSASVTSAGLFLAGDAGRQFRVGAAAPIYTVQAYVDVNTITLDQVYSRPTATGPATIFDGYATLPVDFRRFLVVYDTYYQRTLPFWLSEDEIAIVDPARRFTDLGPRYLVSRKYSGFGATLGQVQYEYWPYPTADRSYPYLYIRSADTLSDATPLPGVWSTRSDVLKLYVLSRGALWPGTADQRNPFFSPQTAVVFKQEWETALQQLTLADDNEYPQQSWYINWARRVGALAPTASLLRQTDATINDYF